MKTEMKRNFGYVKYVSRACAFAVTLLVIAPAMLKGDSLLKAMTNEPKQLPAVVDDLSTEKTDEMTSTIPEIQGSQQDDPLGVAFLRDLKIQQILPTVGNEVKANLVLTKYRKGGNENDVCHVYYIKHSYSNSNRNQFPPEVKGLIYHDLGGENSYLGIIISEELYNTKTSVIAYRRMESEVKLNDEKSAQFLLDLRTNDTKWNNKTEITFIETTNPKVMPPQVY